MEKMTMVELTQAIDSYFRGEIWAVDVYTAADYSAELLRRLQPG